MPMLNDSFFVLPSHHGSTKKLSLQKKRVFMQNTRFFLLKTA